MLGRLVAVAAIFILFGFGVGAVQQGYFDAGMEGGASETKTETVTVDEGNVTSLAESNDNDLVYIDQEDVTVTQAGTTFPPQGNWSWNQHNGTILWVSGTALTDGNNADVTYSFAKPTGEQRLIKDTSVGVLNPILDEWILLAGLILVASAVAILAGRGQ